MLMRIVAASALAICASRIPAFAETANAPTPSPAPGGTAETNVFSDVPVSSWAYDALRRLAADGFLRGYPNQSLKGEHPLTRYEMAVLADRATNAIEAKMAAGAEVDRDDIAAIRKLDDDLAAELKDVKTQVAALQKETSANTEQVGVVKDQLRRMQFHVGYFLRPGTYSDDVKAVNGPTQLGKGASAIAPNAVLPGGLGPAPLGRGLLGPAGTDTPGAGQNALTTGDYQHGTAYQDFRLALTGNVDARTSYNIRLENKLYLDGTNYLSTATPSYCTSTTASAVSGVNPCGSQAYQAGNSSVRFNVGYIQFKPGDFWVRLGRYQQDEGLSNVMELSLGSYLQGIEFGYDNHRLSVEAGYGFGDSSLTNLALNGPTASTSQQGMYLKTDYDTSRTSNVGFTFADYLGTSSTFWNPSATLLTPGTGTTNAAGTFVPASYILGPNGDPVTGQYQRMTIPLVNAGLYTTQLIGKNVKVTLENNHRFGNDPFTGKPWIGADAYGAEIDYSSKSNFKLGPLFPGTGAADANVVGFGYETAGFNSLGPANGYTGTTPYQAFYINSLNGYYYYYLTAQHWFNPNFRAGLVFQHFGLQPGTSLPAGSPSCPACYIAADNRNALFLDTYFVF